MTRYYYTQNAYFTPNKWCYKHPNEDSLNLVMDLDEMKYYMESVYDKKVELWFRAMDIYDQEITTHTLRVTAISLELGRLLGLKKEDLVYIQFGTILHDIGKLGIPDAIIQKPGKLTAEEYQVVQKHPLYAKEWISHRNHFEPAKVIPLFHHERWDGAGYPYRLKGTEIPLLARIVAVVDVWDAVTSDRPYRSAMSKKTAIKLIKSESGTHFDPKIVEAFLKLDLDKSTYLPINSVVV